MRLKSNHDKNLRLSDNRTLPAGSEIFVPDDEWASLQHDTLVANWLATKHVEAVSDGDAAPKGESPELTGERTKRASA